MTLQTFVAGLIGLIVGLVFGIFLGYGVTFETVHAFLKSPATYGWASALGATGAAFIALGIGWFQNRQTRQLWERTVERENRVRKLANIRHARKMAENIDKSKRAFDSIEIDGATRILHVRILYVFNGTFKKAWKEALYIPECTIDLSQATDCVNKALRLASVDYSDRPEYISTIGEISQSMRAASAHIERVQATLRREYSPKSLGIDPHQPTPTADPNAWP